MYLQLHISPRPSPFPPLLFHALHGQFNLRPRNELRPQAANLLLQLKLLRLSGAGVLAHVGHAALDILGLGLEPGRLLLSLVAARRRPFVKTPLLPYELFVLLRQVVAKTLDFFLL